MRYDTAGLCPGAQEACFPTGDLAFSRLSCLTRYRGGGSEQAASLPVHSPHISVILLGRAAGENDKAMFEHHAG